MSFGNLQLRGPTPSYGQEPGQKYGFGRSFARRSQPRSDTQSASQAQLVRTSSEGFSGKSKTDLTVVTAEGDRITISLAAQVKYAASSQTGPGGSSQSVTSSTSSQLRVAVKGDLNEAELKDLGTLLSNLSQATSQAQSTDSSNASPAAPDASASNAGFAGLTSLAAFAYSYKQTVEAGTLIRSIG